MPAWLVVLVVWIFVALASYNTGYLTLPMGSVENLVDRCGKVATVGVMAEVRAREKGKGEDKEKKGKTEREGHGDMDGDEDERWLVSSNEHGDWKSLWSVGTDAVLDVPIGGVCEILYGSEREVNDAHSDVLA